jgi:hypothetical protein
MKRFWVQVTIVTKENAVERIQILIECEFEEQSHVIAEMKLRALGLKPSGEMSSRQVTVEPYAQD